MGRKQNRKPKKSSQNKSVTIITIVSDINFLECIASCIHNQDYSNILEWIIASNNSENMETIKSKVDEFKENYELPNIQYVVPSEDHKDTNGALYNLCNKNSSGDVIVLMEDNSFYYPERVSHAVTKLVSTKAMIVGLISTLIYDSDSNTFLEFSEKSKQHTLLCSLAYTRKYSNTHLYDEDKNGIKSFTNDFTENIVLLNINQTMCVFDNNDTIFKKRDMINESYYNNKKLIVNRKLEKIITNEKTLELYNNIFTKTTESEYDIVVHLGFNDAIDPRRNLSWGRFEKFIKISHESAKQGFKVAFYGNFSINGTFDDVDFLNYDSFKFRTRYKKLVLHSHNGYYPALKMNILADNIYAVVDDIPVHPVLLNYNDKIDKFIVSNDKFKHRLWDGVHDKILVIDDPIDINLYQLEENVDYNRYKYRMCCVSTKIEFILHFLRYSFPLIRKLIPLAELHVYCNMRFANAQLREVVLALLSQEGVMYSGKINDLVLSHEYHLSTYNVCVDPIYTKTIQESLLAGCIPVILHENSDMGFQCNVDSVKEEEYENLAINIIKHIRDLDESEIKMDKPTVMCVEESCNLFLTELNLIDESSIEANANQEVINSIDDDVEVPVSK